MSLIDEIVMNIHSTKVSKVDIAAVYQYLLDHRSFPHECPCNYQEIAGGLNLSRAKVSLSMKELIANKEIIRQYGSWGTTYIILRDIPLDVPERTQDLEKKIDQVLNNTSRQKMLQEWAVDSEEIATEIRFKPEFINWREMTDNEFKNLLEVYLDAEWGGVE